MLCYTHWAKQKYQKANSLNTVSHKNMDFLHNFNLYYLCIKQAKSLINKSKCYTNNERERKNYDQIQFL